MALNDEITALSPFAFWKLNDAPAPPSVYGTYGTGASEAGGRTGTYTSSGEYGHPSLDISGTDTCIKALSGSYVNLATSPLGIQELCLNSFSVFFLFKTDAAGWPSANFFYAGTGATTGYRVRTQTSGEIEFDVGHNTTPAIALTTGAGLNDDMPHSGLFVFDATDNSCTIYLDGVEASYATDQAGVGSRAAFTAIPPQLGADFGGWFQKPALFASALTASDAATLHAAALGPVSTGVSSLPMTLTTDKSVAASTLPMRMCGQSYTAASSLPMQLESADPTHFTADSATWHLAVELGGTDIISGLLGPVKIEHQEDSSGTCSLSFLPAAGSIDPEAYENLSLQVSFLELDSSGVEQGRVQRYTGKVEAASYDPDNGVVTISATTDLQGRLENLDRAVIADMIGGEWSEHVFDDTADGYQYALDRLSTLTSEMHIDNYGRFQVVPWAAKGTADVELTDSGRFNDTLSLQRVQRRDLVTRFEANLDFRFVRLRHREIKVHWVSQLGFCHYLDNNWKLASKDMIRSAADGTAWTRITDISWSEVPVAGTYCTPPRIWVGNAEAFALGASWTAARRWAQTVTEEKQLILVATDLEETAGEQLLAEDYGIEATYDATDYEQMQDFTASPTGSAYSSNTGDWMLDAVTAEADGRTAMEAAQSCLLAKGRAEILGRARRNLLTFTPVYRPDITLAHTVRVNTPYLVAKGKVKRIVETLDPYTGRQDMELGVALSRHGGSGLAVDDPLDPVATPDAPAEEASSRLYTLGYHLGSTTTSPADSDAWDGYVINVGTNGVLYDAAGEVYSERFVLAMPEIEDAARDAAAVQQAQTYEVVVPEDELTMSA